MSAAAISPATTTAVQELKRLVRATRRRLRWSWLAAGVCLFVGLVAAALLLGVLFDLAFVLPDFGRWFAFAAVAVVGLLIFLGRILRPTLTRLPTPGVALRIERRTENMHNRLLTVLDLADKPLGEDSTTFFDAVVEQTTERLRGFEPSSVVDQRSLARAVRWGIVPTAVLVAAAMLSPQFVGVALQRVLQPWADIPPPSLLRFNVQPGNAEVLLGDSAPIIVAIDGGRPEEIRLKFASESGERTVHVKRGEDGYKYTIEKFSEPLAYRVYAGRTWTKEYRLSLVQRPVLESVRLRVHPPTYLAGAPVKDVRPEDRTIDVLEGSEIEATVEGTGEIVEADVIRYRERQENRIIVDDRSMRWLVQDSAPQGAWEFGHWNWDWSQKFRRTHGESAQNHETRHGLGVNPPITVRDDDAFVTHVLVDPAKVPTQILIEMNDGNGWEHRAYWGANKLNKSGVDGAPANLRLGDVPKPGEWVRLEIPAKAIGMGGRTVREFAFCVFGGAVRWDWTGIAAGRNDPKTIRETQPPTKLVATDQGWNGRFGMEWPTVFHVELRDSAGRTNAEPDDYAVRIIPDRPPTARMVTPGKDVVVSTAAPVELSAAVTDDVGLAKADLLMVRTREQKRLEKPIWAANGNPLHERIRATAVLAELDMKPGDELKYRIRVRDRKGQTGLSEEFKIAVAPNDASAIDKAHERFADERKKLTEKVEQLAKREEKIAAKSAEIAKKYEAEAADDRPPQRDEPDSRTETSKPKDEKAESEAKPQAKDEPQANEKSQTNEKANEKPQTKQSPNQKFTQQERKELSKLAKEQNDVRHKIEQATKELKQLLASPDAQSASAPELRALDDAARDLERNAAPDAKTAMQNLTRAAQTDHHVSNAKPAAEAAETTKNDLDRALAAMERSKKLERAGDNPEAANADGEQAESNQMDAAATAAAEELDAARERMDRLRNEVGEEQKQQEKLTIAANNAEAERELKDVDNRQRGLEGRAKETLKEVQEALGGSPPRDLSAENRPEEAGLEAMQPSEGKDGEKQPEGNEDQGPPKGAGEKDAVPTPNSEGQKQGGRKSGESKDGDPQGQKQGGEASNGDVPQFETLNKQAGKKGRGGKQGADLRKELDERQGMLTRDLDKASKALSGKSGEFAQTVDQLKKALGDGQRSSALLNDPQVLKQLELAMKAQRSDSKAKGRPANRGMVGLLEGMLPGVRATERGADASLTDDIASMKLEPRDREELLQGAKAPTPESYRPFVRDYYNRLSESKPK